MGLWVLISVIESARPPFLLLTLPTVFLGWSVSASDISVLNLSLVLLAALAAHVCVNTLNEYFDFKSGLDARTSRTPFSGGSGALPSNPEAARSVLILSLVALVVVVLVGFYFVQLRGWRLLLLGLLGLGIVLAYTPWLNRSPVLCLLAPGLAFGPVMVVGTTIALTGEASMSAWWVSIVSFLLVSNLLLLNQFPDVEADRSAGRHHLLIAHGRQRGVQIYGLFLLLAVAVVVSGVALSLLPVLALVALLPLLLGLARVPGIARHVKDSGSLVPYMGVNVGITLLTPVLLGTALLLR